MAAVCAEAVAYLARELARRAQYQDAAGFSLRRLTIGKETMQNRQGESRRLAGAGLCNADDIASGEGDRDGLRLDRRGCGVFLLVEGACDGVGEAEDVETGQWLNFL